MRKIVKHVDDLDVYQRSYKTALDIHKFSLSMPQTEQYAMASQIRRASKGICANMAEGFAKHNYSSAEFKRFLQMAKGSSAEMIVWLNFCKDLDYLEEDIWKSWTNEYSAISKMLNGLIAKWKD